MATETQNLKAENLEEWTEKKTILVVLAHPDDPEFFCGASIARWVEMGHHVHYCLLTRGERGIEDGNRTAEEIKQIRMTEQSAAAKVLGVESVQFYDYPDGYLVPSLEARKDVVRAIRQVGAQIVVTSDPTNYYPRLGYINHPDHRLAGEIGLSAVFPAAGNRLFFPELIEKEGLQPVPVKEIWVTLTHQPTIAVDVTAYWPKRWEALIQHASQIKDKQALWERQLNRRVPESTIENPRYEDGFRRLILG
jgi:LmbE family N-acetylglucosaminyl deacetylase